MKKVENTKLETLFLLFQKTMGSKELSLEEAEDVVDNYLIVEDSTKKFIKLRDSLVEGIKKGLNPEDKLSKEEEQEANKKINALYAKSSTLSGDLKKLKKSIFPSIRPFDLLVLKELDLLED